MKKLISLAAIALIACGTTPSSDKPASASGEAKPAEAPAPAEVSLLNVSYDPTRELYQDYN